MDSIKNNTNQTLIYFVGMGSNEIDIGMTIVNASGMPLNGSCVWTIPAAAENGLFQDYTVSHSGSFVKEVTRNDRTYTDLQLFVGGSQPMDAIGKNLLGARDCQPNGQMVLWLGSKKKD